MKGETPFLAAGARSVRAKPRYLHYAKTPNYEHNRVSVIDTHMYINIINTNLGTA